MPASGTNFLNGAEGGSDQTKGRQLDHVESEVLWAAGDDDDDADDLLNIIDDLEREGGSGSDSSISSLGDVPDDNARPSHLNNPYVQSSPHTCGGLLAKEMFMFVTGPHQSAVNQQANPGGVVDEEPRLQEVVNEVLSRLRAPASVVLTYLIADLVVNPEDGSVVGEPIQQYRIAKKNLSTAPDSTTPQKATVNLLGKGQLRRVRKMVALEHWCEEAVPASPTESDSGRHITMAVHSPTTAEHLRVSPTHILLRSPNAANHQEFPFTAVSADASLKKRQSITNASFVASIRRRPAEAQLSVHQPSQLLSLAYCSAFCGFAFNVFVDENGERVVAAATKESDNTSPTSHHHHRDLEQVHPRLIEAEDFLMHSHWEVILGRRLPEVLFSLVQMQEPRGPTILKKAATSLLSGLLRALEDQFVPTCGGPHLRVVLEVLLDLWRRVVELEYALAVEGALPILPDGALSDITRVLFHGAIPHLSRSWTAWSKEHISGVLCLLYDVLSLPCLFETDAPDAQGTHHHHNNHHDHTHHDHPPHSPVGFLSEEDGEDGGLERKGVPLTYVLWRKWLSVDKNGLAFAKLHSSAVVRWNARRLLDIAEVGGGAAPPKAPEVVGVLLPTVASVERFVRACCSA